MVESRGKKRSQISEQLTLRYFGSDVLVFSAGTGLLLIFSLIQALIIPKYLSQEGYGYWQLFRLYASYVGILHLGFVDGILVRWAGKELAQVGSEIKTALRFLLLEQLIVIVPLCLVFYFLFHPPLQWIGLMLLIYTLVANLATFFMFTAQAVRKFKMLTLVNVGRGLLFLLLIIILFVSGYFDYHHVIFAFLATFFITLLALALWFRKYLWGETPAIGTLLAYGKENIDIGIFVLLGNFVVILFLTIDRLMVSRFFSIEQFAIYAFALSVATVTYTFVQGVSQVFFPYLSATVTELRSRAYHLGKPAIILSWAVILVIYFPLVRLIELYLPSYVASLPIMQILLGTVGFGSIIQVLHINYYKAYRKQRQYLLWGITALAVSVMLNLVAINIWGSLESVAIATFVSFGLWYIMNELSLKSVVMQHSQELGKDLVIICSYLGAFWLSTFLNEWFVSRMLIYIGFFLLVTWVFLRTEVRKVLVVVQGLRDKHE